MKLVQNSFLLIIQTLGSKYQLSDAVFWGPLHVVFVVLKVFLQNLSLQS